MTETPPLLSLSRVLLRFRDDNEGKEKDDGGCDDGGDNGGDDVKDDAENRPLPGFEQAWHCQRCRLVPEILSPGTRQTNRSCAFETI